MTEQRRVSKPRVHVSKNTRTEVIDADTRTRAEKEKAALAAELAAELDAILDDIDGILAETQISARDYVQKGGE